jgi:hypothetical protein
MEPAQIPLSQRLGLQRWMGAALVGGVVILALMLTWFLASDPVGAELRKQPASYLLGVVVLAGGLFVLLVYRSHSVQWEEQWNALVGVASRVAPMLVKPLLYCAVGGVLTLSYHSLKGVESLKADGASLLPGIIALCALPALLTFCVALLVERNMARKVFDFEVDPVMEKGSETGKALVEHLRANWNYEREIMRGSIQRMGRHAAILGFLASSILATSSAVIIVTRGSPDMRHHVATAVATAATISFTLHLGQIFFRSASNDATARMMAGASRTLLVVAISALFFGSFFLGQEAQSVPGAASNPLKGRTGALLIGVAVALLGERVLSSMTSRAAGLLGVDAPPPVQAGDLSVIDGLTPEDAARLAEERVDSVHALALTPTPRVFFNTIYGLQRICDWQDQALLITRVGRTNALLLREQYFIRGAIAARQYALREFGGGASANALKDAPAPPPAAPEQVPADAPPAPDAAVAAGKPPAQASPPRIAENSHLHWALHSLIHDKDIERLEIFWRSTPVLKSGVGEA